MINTQIGIDGDYSIIIFLKYISYLNIINKKIQFGRTLSPINNKLVNNFLL